MAPFSNVTDPYMFILALPSRVIVESSSKSRYKSKQCKNLLNPVCILLSTLLLFSLKNASALCKENSKIFAENLQVRGIFVRFAGCGEILLDIA
jgi:hypothetical protein